MRMQRGFSLIEVVVAMAILSTATIALGQLSMVAAGASRAARSSTIATVIAVQKMEQLRSAAWAELSASPAGALVQNTDGYCDFLDGSGRVLAARTSPPRGAVFVRRWAIERLAASDALIVQVSVVPMSDAGGAVVRPRLEEVRIVAIKTRL